MAARKATQAPLCAVTPGPGERSLLQRDNDVIWYHHDTELVIDVLRHGADVEVVASAALRTAVRGALERALGAYRAGR